MQEALPYIVVIQLILTLVLAVLLFGLARQVGILHERVAPMGAMTSDHGPSVGDHAPVLVATTLAGTRIDVGGPSAGGRTRLLLFVSPACPVCKKLLPIVQSFASAERVQIVLVGDGNLADQRAMIQRFALEEIPYLHSPEIGMAYQVGKLPYAVLIDSQGVIRAKGLVNSREHLESLVVAAETGFATIQDYLAARAHSGAAAGNPNPPLHPPAKASARQPPEISNS
jgi:methylamine dehydrogenase accessory protein MauD